MPLVSPLAASEVNFPPASPKTCMALLKNSTLIPKGSRRRGRIQCMFRCVLLCPRCESLHADMRYSTIYKVVYIYMLQQKEKGALGLEFDIMDAIILYFYLLMNTNEYRPCSTACYLPFIARTYQHSTTACNRGSGTASA